MLKLSKLVFLILLLRCFCLKHSTIFVVNACGRETYTPQNNRILGGTNTFGWKYPWFGLLINTDDSKPYCGASLISTRHVLTAAHCYDQYLFNSGKFTKSINEIYDIQLGVTNLCTPSQRQQRFRIKTVVIHPNYLDFSLDLSGDIAILTTYTELSDYQPICLPSSGDLRQKTVGQVIGFGITQYNWLEMVCVMREIHVNIFTATECIKSDNDASFNNNDTLCAGIQAGGIDACQGDSGGPLQGKSERNVNFLIGIVSYGKLCGLKNHPGIYTSVTFYLDWINKNTKKMY